MTNMPQPLTQAQAVPGARIIHLRSGWRATIVRVAWPALWVTFDTDLASDRQDQRHVRGWIFGLLPQEGALCSPPSSTIPPTTTRAPTPPPGAGGMYHPSDKEQS